MEKTKIFISHRHSDTQSDCRALKSELQKHFGKENVFLDIENLEPGIKFAEAIEKTLAQSKVVLVAIGPDWFGAEDQNGVSRLFQPKDWVRREVAASLASSDTRVIPILLKGVTVPEVDHLPDDLKSLAELQAAEIDNKRWDYDVSELVKVLEKIVPKKRDPTPHPEPVSRPATFAPPPAKPKSWWAKNYLWMIGGLVGFLILVGMCAPDEEYINPIDNDTIARDQLVQEAEALVDTSPNQDPRVTNPEGNEIYESLTLDNEQNSSADAASILIIYTGDNYGCVLGIEITIGDVKIVPTGNQFTAAGIPSGNQRYTISGQIACATAGNCMVSGEGVIKVSEGTSYYVVWQNTGQDQCTMVLQAH